MREQLEKSIGRMIACCLVVATIVVTPQWSIDPINPIKMLTILAFSFMCIGLLLLNHKLFFWGNFKVPLVLISGFLLWQVPVMFVSTGDLSQQFFGVTGRNTGFLTYLAFSLLFVASMFVSGYGQLTRILKATYIAGISSIFYGLIQFLGHDPIDWVSPFSPVFGFLGNPNFQSSLLGMLGVIVFAHLLEKNLSKKFRIQVGIYLVLTLFVVKETNSQQGFLIIFFGVVVVIGVQLFHRARQLSLYFAGVSLIGIFIVLCGILNKGPLAALLYKDSVTFRGDYWRAGWQMTLDHPLFGVGMDNYGDWYRRSRSLEATLRRGPDVISNAAHNVYLDISSFGGFPLLLIYTALTILVLVSAFKVFSRQPSFNSGFTGLFGGWVAFQAQSIISINQIGLAVWGWVFAGLIIGYEINTRNLKPSEEFAKINRTENQKTSLPASSVLAVTISLVLGFAIGSPPFSASAKFKHALESGDVALVQEAAYSWPRDPFRMSQIAATLAENKFESEALGIALDATKMFPDSFGAWATLNLMKSANSEQRMLARIQMKRLDPLNPTLK
jgi:O-antigen ligase